MARLAVVLVHITLTTLLTVYSDAIAGAFNPDAVAADGVETGQQPVLTSRPTPLLDQPLVPVQAGTWASEFLPSAEGKNAERIARHAEALVMR